jgi:beta-phosphoglucomutase-like phosphatase (HAD superfamily)
MQLNTVIFDMDGLLIDSEPLWEEAGKETLQQFDIALSTDQYHHSTGLRTSEWIGYWFHHFGIDQRFAADAEEAIVKKAIEKIRDHALPMPGADMIFPFCDRNFKIGLATSSPLALANVVIEKLGIASWLNAVSSAEFLPFGKPHPDVYMHCASALKSSPLECICFEDSFNGMISVKAARMTCVVIPAADHYLHEKWGAADLKIPSLSDFSETLLEQLLA